MNQPPRPPPERSLAERQAEAFFKSAQLVKLYVDDFVRPQLDQVLDKSKRDQFLYGLFLRTVGWMKSLYKLNDGSDFQAIVTANRSLFETLIDVVILHTDDQGTWTERMEAWEHSHRFRHAKRVVEHYGELKVPVPDQYTPIEQFYKKFEGSMDTLRVKYWPNKKNPTTGHHPEHWSHENLGGAAEAADKISGLGLKTYYRTRYHWLCMNVHGSTTVGIRGLSKESIHAMVLVSLGDCADCAMDITERVLKSVGKLWEKNPDLPKRHEELQQRRREIAISVQLPLPGRPVP